MIQSTLAQASQGLMMPSESEHPFQSFHWAGQATTPLTPTRLLQLAEQPSDRAVEPIALDYLFRNVAQPQEWHDAIQQANVAKFQALVTTLQANLSDLQVYRVGTVHLDVYIVGKNGDDLAGLATKIIET